MLFLQEWEKTRDKFRRKHFNSNSERGERDARLKPDVSRIRYGIKCIRSRCQRCIHVISHRVTAISKPSSISNHRRDCIKRRNNKTTTKRNVYRVEVARKRRYRVVVTKIAPFSEERSSHKSRFDEEGCRLSRETASSTCRWLKKRTRTRANRSYLPFFHAIKPLRTLNGTGLASFAALCRAIAPFLREKISHLSRLPPPPLVRATEKSIRGNYLHGKNLLL